MIRAAIYALFSTETQSADSNEDQVRVSKKHAERLTLSVVAQFSDAAIGSGTHSGRVISACSRTRDCTNSTSSLTRT